MQGGDSSTNELIATGAAAIDPALLPGAEHDEDDDDGELLLDVTQEHIDVALQVCLFHQHSADHVRPMPRIAPSRRWLRTSLASPQQRLGARYCASAAVRQVAALEPNGRSRLGDRVLRQARDEPRLPHPKAHGPVFSAATSPLQATC